MHKTSAFECIRNGCEFRASRQPLGVRKNHPLEHCCIAFVVAVQKTRAYTLRGFRLQGRQSKGILTFLRKLGGARSALCLALAVTRCRKLSSHRTGADTGTLGLVLANPRRYRREDS